MGVLREIPSVNQIIASRYAIEAADGLDIDVPREIVERAAWPIEKAWDYEPPAHPILDGSGGGDSEVI